MSDNGDNGDAEDRRRQGIRLKLPGGTEVEIRGLTTIMALLLVLTGISCWTGWQVVEQLVKLGDAVQVQTRAINMMSCMLQEMEPAKRKERFEECARWFR